MARSANEVLALTLRKLARAEQSETIRRIIMRSHPADLAHVLESLTPLQQIRVFREIQPLKKAADVLNEMDPAFSERIIEMIDDDYLALLITEMGADDVASILRTLESPRKESLLAELPIEEASEAEALCIYRPKSAGALMSTNYFVVYEDTSAEDAIRNLHDSNIDVIFYLYIINDHEQLVGVVSLRELVRAKGKIKVSEIMLGDVIRVDVETDQEEVARLVARYNFLALPVTESNTRLVGVVTVDDIIDVIRLEATEDIMHSAGAGVDASPNESIIESFRTRVPWSVPSLFAGLTGLLILSYYSDLLTVFPIVALIPVFIGIAGHVGTQSSTIITRWLATGRLEFAVLGRVIFREIWVGALIGFVFGLVVSISATFLFKDDLVNIIPFSVGTSLSMVFSTSVAAGIGATAPLVFEKTGFDPAIAAGPLVTTSIDVLGLWVFLFTMTFFI